MAGPRLTPVEAAALCIASKAIAIEKFDETCSASVRDAQEYVVAMTTATPAVGQYERTASPYPLN